MKITLKHLACLLVTTVFISCSSTKKVSSDDEFTTIFNGKNWDGWYLKIRNGDEALAKQVFQIEDGGVHVFKEVPKGSEEGNGKNPTHGLFYSNKTYSKYILKFEYKWGKNKANTFSFFQYDAGLYYHVINDKIWPTGIEYQIRYNHIKDKNNTGDIWGLPGYDWTAKDNQFALPEDGGTPQAHRGLEHLSKPTRNFNALNDKWNQVEVIVMGNKYAIHKLNGEVINMLTNLPMSEGKIGLQSETAEVYYRNIKIKEFNDFVPAETFLK